MNKLRTILPVALLSIAALFTSCSDDGDLEDRLDNIEESLGTNEPLKATFETTDYDNNAITHKADYLFKTNASDDAVYKYGENEYEVTIERYFDVARSEWVEIQFYYNAETKTVTNGHIEIFFFNQYGNRYSPDFYQGNTGNSLEIEVLAFNPETGKMSINVTGTTTSEAGNNLFEGEPMSITAKFRGTMRMFEGQVE